MISLISYILVIVGAFNWFSIGVLQFDFIAGIFGSQANIFSRVVYAIIGFAALWLIYATIKQRGKIFVNGKKENDAKLLGKMKDAITMKKHKENNEHEKNENHSLMEEDTTSQPTQDSMNKKHSDESNDSNHGNTKSAPSTQAKNEYNTEEF